MRRSALILCLCCLCAAVATAAIITVDTHADDTTVNGNCTLREVVIAANTNAIVDQCNEGGTSGTDRVLVVPPLDPIQLTLGQIQVTEQVIEQ